jgi:hypothetical protein
MWLPLTTVGLIVAGMAAFGFYDKAKYLAAHPEENPDAAKKKV